MTNTYHLSVPSLPLPPSHHQVEELDHVIVPVQVQALAQVGVSLAQAQVVLVLPHLGDAGLTASPVALYFLLWE